MLSSWSIHMPEPIHKLELRLQSCNLSRRVILLDFRHDGYLLAEGQEGRLKDVEM